MRNSVLQLQSIIKYFDDNLILSNISLDFKRNSVTTIIGPSGSGKSTLLRCINQLETITDGHILFNGQDITDINMDINKIRSKIGMVFQSFNLFDNLTVLENCIIGPTKVLKIEKEMAIEEAHKYLEKVGMLEFKDRKVTTLSGGQKQRVAIARTLCMNPEVILFDEPTSSLDPEMVNEVLTVMKEVMKNDITFIIVTHEMEFARDVSDRIIFMDNANVVEDGTPTYIFDQSTNERLGRFLNR